MQNLVCRLALVATVSHVMAPGAAASVTDTPSAANWQFDFWLGERGVSTTQGSVPAGKSKIELILEDCVVLGNWKSLNNPYSGKSYHIYDQALERWEQYWVDHVGGNIFFQGELLEAGVRDYWT